MTEFIEIRWTSGSMDEARKVCRYLVQERLVACAEIVPWVESVYMWNNQLETTQESKIYLKTRLDKYDEIKEIIIKNCTYQIPQIIYTKIDGGNQEYLNWLEESAVSRIILK
ncbi:MAG TPA: divalent-cation tolerance protein CutA [Waddliaceae bacterium]